MANKPDGVICQIREQVFEDPVTGLTFQFEAVPNGEYRLRVYGESLPFGNREYMFDKDGTRIGAGTHTVGLCRPAWLTSTD